MNEPTLSDLAKDDLAEIWATIAAARDERTAERMTRKILEKCRSHAQFPESGRSREDIVPGLRSFPVRPYVVFFRAEGESILVLRILHGHRDVEGVMKGERP
jgi:toxin ParE1/3/4